MKYIFNKAFIFCLIILATGCGKDFLNRNNPGDLSYDKVYKSEKDFEAALAGCYQSINGPATTNVYLGDIISDNVYVTRYNPTGDLPDFDKLSFSALNGTLSGYWSDNYKTIERVNFLIDKIATSTIEEQKVKRIIAEARFLRAYSYFNLVRIFGDVPLHDKPVDINKVYDVPRSKAEDVLKLAIDDLKEAENVDSYRAPDELAKKGGRVTPVAAKALLGKVYLWQKDFQNAETTLGDIVENSGSLGLALENLSTLYDPDKPFNKEIIFSINYARSTGLGSPFVSTLIPYNTPPGIYPNITVPTGSGFGMIEPFVASKFLPSDKRSSLIDSAIFTNLGIKDTNIYSLKYVDPLTTFNSLSGSNTIILRYADVLLMYAEALNENSKTALAYQYINQVRVRAGIGDLPAGYSKAQMFKALADERQKEFLLEGDRWFDLRFRGIDFLKQAMNDFKPNAYLPRNRDIVIKDNYILFPIPEDQIQIKPLLKQNDGY
jgi:hypothetical protein